MTRGDDPFSHSRILVNEIDTSVIEGSTVLIEETPIGIKVFYGLGDIDYLLFPLYFERPEIENDRMKVDEY